MRRLAFACAAVSLLCSAGCSSSDGSAASAGQAGDGGDVSPAAGTAPSAGSAGQSGAPSGSGTTSGGTGEVPPGGASAGGSDAMSGGGAVCTGATPLAPPTPTACETAAGSTPADAALTRLNELRARMGLPCMALIEAITASAQKHCDYYQQNADDPTCTANAHEEVAGCAGYVDKSFANRMTLAGYTGSPRSEVMAFSGDPSAAIAMWINSVYHRTPLLSPWIAEMGYGVTDECDTIDMGQGPKAPDSLTAVYPYPGQAGVPLDFDGSHEGPMPPKPAGGWPSASPIHLYVKAYTVTSHQVFVKDGCEPLAHQWLPEKDDYILYPDEPFAPGTEYRVLITGTKGGAALDFDWSFTTER